MKNHRRSGSLATAALLSLLVLGGGARAATLAERQDLVANVALFYGDHFLFGPADQPRGTQVIPDVQALSPGFVAAALKTGMDTDTAATVLQTLLSAQDADKKSLTYGLFPPLNYNSAPTLEATCRLLPLLAWIGGHDQALPDALRGRVSAALELGYVAVKKATVPAGSTYLSLLRAAALATAGQALQHEEGPALAQGLVRDWLKWELTWGCTGGHGPGREALQLGALCWVAASGPDFPELDQALRLAYADLIQRLQLGSGAVAGAAAVASSADYAEGGELHSYLLYLWGAAPAPAVIRPTALYFAACGYVPEALVAGLSAPPAPRLMYTLGRDQNPKNPLAIIRTDTYVTDLFSLGTMSGPLEPESVPLMVTLAQADDRPTAYFYANSTPARVTSLQQKNVAAVSVDFLAAGGPGSPQAYLLGVLGPRRDIKQVLISGDAWPDQPAAVSQGSVVAVERAGVYLGVRIMQCGPALAEAQIEGAKPGVLQWQGDGPDAELELYVYARKQTYTLKEPEAYLLAGVLVDVEPAGTAAYPTLADFSHALLIGKLRQTISFNKELVKPQEDPSYALLHPTEPQMRVEFTVVPHLFHDLTFADAQVSLHLKEDLVPGRVLAMEAQGTALPAVGPWQSPLLSLPWDARQARASLTAAAH